MSSRSQRSLRIAALVGTTALLTSGAGLLLAGTAFADATTGLNDNRYSLLAEGDGLYAYVYNGLLPAVPYVDASAYTAEAENNSQGNSSAFAGLPYPGKTGSTLPGTVNGLSGGNLPPLPALPGYVSTSYPSTKDETQSQGPYLIHAASDAQTSSATAGGGVSPTAGDTNQQIFSTANVIANADGSVSAKATAGVDAISIGPIDIGNISSSLSITSDGVAAPKIVSSTKLGTISVLGFTLGVDDTGFNVLGDSLALPTKTILDQINSALTQGGLKLEVIPGDKYTSSTTGQTSATSAELRITETKDVPVAGPTQTVFTLGRATASVANFPIDAGGTTDGDSSTSGDSSGGSLTDPSTSGTTGDTSAGSDPSTGSGLPQIDPGSSAGTTTGGLPAPPLVDPNTGASSSGGSATHPTALGLLAAGAPKGTETWAIYLVLVLAGVGIVGGQQLFRTIGVRLALRGA